MSLALDEIGQLELLGGVVPATIGAHSADESQPPLHQVKTLLPGGGEFRCAIVHPGGWQLSGGVGRCGLARTQARRR